MKGFKRYLIEEKESELAKKRGYNIYPVYHGSNNKFTVFSYKYLGKIGSSDGKGFNFTNLLKVAKMFGDNIYKCYISIHKPLDNNKITISKNDYKKFIRAVDPDGNSFLSNYGDVNSDGYNNILNDYVENMYDVETNDVDLILEVINLNSGNEEEIYNILYNTLGYDGIINNKPEWGYDQTVYIVFRPNDIKLMGITKDDSGEIIPYEKRFDKKNKDIRF